MEKDEQLSSEQSLAIIHQMISQAKTNITDSGIHWLLWGMMLFLSSICTYFFIDNGASQTFLAWNIFGAITIILLIYDAFKPSKKAAKTYVDDLMKMVDIAFFICIFVIIVSMNADAIYVSSGFGFFLMIFAFLMLVKGGAAKSRSLMVGAAVNWAAAIAVFIIKDLKSTMLIMAAAVLIGYIIPGFLLRSQYKRSMSQKNNPAL